MSHIKKNLPSYKNPPITEVVCGLRFKKLDSVLIPHVGLIWEKFKKEYPNIRHARPLFSDNEIIVDTYTGAPIPRVWFINNKDDQLIQFQYDRFYFNWRRKKEKYPRYRNVIKNFESTHKTITDFFNENDLGNIIPVEYELSYFNHINKGEIWNSFEEISKVFRDFNWKTSKDRFLKYPEKIRWNIEFNFPDDHGKLIVNLRDAVRISDKLPVLRLELKASGEGDSIENIGTRKWFDLAHEWIVNGFTDLTTLQAHKFWEKE